MKTRLFLVTMPLFLLLALCAKAQEAFPRVWCTYFQTNDFEGDIKDMKAHGVNGIEWERLGDKEKVHQQLLVLRKYGMKAIISGGSMSKWPGGVIRHCGAESVVPALCIAGSYRGLALERNLFEFEARPQKIVIEPPRLNKNQYWTWMRLVKAEVVVPLKEFDGEQHLKIVPATFCVAPEGAKLEIDSADGHDEKQKASRTLYELSFDLTGLDNALLNKVGIAAYWERISEDGKSGCVSVFAESTGIALEKAFEANVQYWTECCKGEFPTDVIKGMRTGDEVFAHTGPASSSKADNYLVWDFSAPAIEAFRKMTGKAMEYPRTLGHPEIYGEEACGAWMYNWHKGCAALVRRAVRKTHEMFPDMVCLRNTTRGDTLCFENDYDGTGQELLMRELDVAHFDPYPCATNGEYWAWFIAEDAEYLNGLARRYGNKPVIPWLQAHRHVISTHPTAEQIDRMLEQHWQAGFDGFVWYGYSQSLNKVAGCYLTVPKYDPACWEKIGQWNKRVQNELPPKHQASIAVVRPYTKRAICVRDKDGIRNPADYNLRMKMRELAMSGQHFDVFEVPPVSCESDEARNMRAEELKKYKVVIYPDEF